jgi:hypothetical protein
MPTTDADRRDLATSGLRASSALMVAKGGIWNGLVWIAAVASLMRQI